MLPPGSYRNYVLLQIVTDSALSSIAMSRGPALGSGSSAAATIIGGATGDQTKGLTFREDINPNGAGNISTVMIPTSLAKIDKHLPVVRHCYFE